MNKFLSSFKEFFLRTIRLYTNNFPIEKGKHRLYLLALKLCGELPKDLKIETKDNRKFSVNLATGMQNTVFFLGEYEKIITDIFSPLLNKNDVCLDIGANFGWYTSIFQKHCKEVHSFEPTLPTFKELTNNVELLEKNSHININNLALGNKFGEIKMYLFPHLATGHASISSHQEKDFVEYKCQMVTLNSYLEDMNVADVNIVKMDIEGAELMCLKGAEKLFEQDVPPIWLIEMALEQTRNFDYLPNELIQFMNSKTPYEFYKIDEINAKLTKIGEFKTDDIGANVICFPKDHYQDRFIKLKSYL